MKWKQSWALSCSCFVCDFTTANRLLFFLHLHLIKGVLRHRHTTVLMVNLNIPETVQRESVLVCDSLCFQDTSSTKTICSESVGAKKLRLHLICHWVFHLLLSSHYCLPEQRLINQTSMEVKGDKAVYSCKKGLLSSLMTQFVDQWTTRSVDYLIFLSGRALSIYWMNLRSLTEHKGRDLCRKR